MDWKGAMQANYNWKNFQLNPNFFRIQSPQMRYKQWKKKEQDQKEKNSLWAYSSDFSKVIKPNQNDTKQDKKAIGQQH